jgi:hypothetical protein
MSWQELGDPAHPLAALGAAPLNRYRLGVLVGPRTRTGAETFGLRLTDPDGLATADPFLVGVFRPGRRPAETWVEVDWVDFQPVLTGRDGARRIVDLEAEGLLELLLGRLAGILPPGGSLMVEYASSRWQETARGLALGVPPAATELGFMLIRAGCLGGFKDWYFAEGGWEGPRKLQAFRPDPARLGERISRLLAELEAYIAEGQVETVPDVDAVCRARAHQVVEYLRGLVGQEGEAG